MAVDGSRWQFLGRSPAAMPRAAGSTTSSLGGRNRRMAQKGMARRGWRGLARLESNGERTGGLAPWRLARLRFVRGFKMAAAA